MFPGSASSSARPVWASTVNIRVTFKSMFLPTAGESYVFTGVCIWGGGRRTRVYLVAGSFQVTSPMSFPEGVGYLWSQVPFRGLGYLGVGYVGGGGRVTGTVEYPGR